MTNIKNKLDILRISDSKDLIADTSLLQKYIAQHDNAVNNRYVKFWNAYACRAKILDTSLIPKKAMNKPDYRIAVNYPRYIVDTFNGFACGISPTASSEDDTVNDYINTIWDANDLDDVNSELHRLKCIFGESYQIVYVDEYGEIATVASDPLESFPVYDNSIRPRLRYFVRTYYDEDNKRHGSISDDTNVYYFDFDAGIHFTEIHPHGFDGVPAIVYTMNKARIGLIEPVLDMCNAYDKAISEKMDDVDSFADAIMKVLGTMLTEDQINDLRDKRIINIGGRDGSQVIVDFMQRPSGDATQEHLLERLEKLIFTIAMVCNVSDNNFATSSGIALRMKMSPMQNLAAGDWRLDQSSMKAFWRLVFSNPVNVISPDAWQTMEFKHYLNYPDDVESAADVAVKLSDVVSKRTQLGILPTSIVPDVDAELEKINAETEEAINRAQALQTQSNENNTETEEETEQTEEENKEET